MSLEVRARARMEGASQQERDVVLHHLEANASRDPQNAAAWLRTYLALPTQPKAMRAIERATAKAALDKRILGQDSAKKVLQGKMNFCQRTGRDRFVVALQGPPGVGKTVLAEELGRVYDRPVIIVRVDGLSDERRLTGYEESYKGFCPGIIIQGLIKAECTNPIIFFDEVDKAASEGVKNFLNQILDAECPNMDSAFLGFPIDLSQAAFIVALNDVTRLSSWLASRLEPMVHMQGYTAQQKATLFRERMLPVLNAPLTDDEKLDWTNEAVRALIAEHARRFPGEASGVRELLALGQTVAEQVLMEEQAAVGIEDVRSVFDLLNSNHRAGDIHA